MFDGLDEILKQLHHKEPAIAAALRKPGDDTDDEPDQDDDTYESDDAGDDTEPDDNQDNGDDTDTDIEPLIDAIREIMGETPDPHSTLSIELTRDGDGPPAMKVTQVRLRPPGA